VAVNYLAPPQYAIGIPQPTLVSALITAYEKVAPLTPAERRALCVLVEVKAARAPMRMLRHVVKAGRDERSSLVGRLARDVQRLREFDEDSSWRQAVAGQAAAGERDP